MILILKREIITFYGRETEIKQFKQSFDQRDEHGKIRNIKCMIVSGIDGIGRFSYARKRTYFR